MTDGNMIYNKFFNRAAMAALLFSIAAGFHASAGNCTEVGKQGQEPYVYPSLQRVDSIVDSVFRKLSTREKIAQIMIIEFDSKDGKRKKAIQEHLVKKEKIGGLIPMNDDLVPAMKRMNRLNSLARIPMLITIDAEWGASMRYWDEIPQFPRQMQLGALSSDSLVYRMGYLLGKECRLLKMQVNYAPDIDINNNPANPAINTRSFGEDKEKVARYGIAIMEGMRDAGVAGSAKHFPGHGDTDVDSHLALPVIPFDYQRLDTLEMYPFKRLVAAGVDMVMVAHLNIPALDPSGVPASISKPIVTGLLREKLGYDGIICTDALNMKGVAVESGLAQRDIPLAAYKAGADILLMPEDVENAITVIENAVKSGEISKEGLDMRVRKMLALKARLGLFDKGYSPYVELEGIEERVVVQENLNLMQQIAKNSMTVLFNDNSSGFGLPVAVEGKKIAYLGYRKAELGREFAKMALKYARIDTVILDNDATLQDLKAAKQQLSGHDLVIVGFNDTDQRPHRGFGINEAEYKFITDWAAEQHMIAVYLGSPYALTKIGGYRNFTSFLIGYSNTRANNFAAVQVVFGGVPAIGVLPVTAASFKVGESVVIPDRFREEYHHFVGTESDSLSMLPYEMGRESALLTLVPQVAELVAGGKIKLADTVGDLLDSNDKDADLSVGELMALYSNPAAASHLQKLLEKYRKYAVIEKVAQQMFARTGMSSTSLSGKVDNVDGNSIRYVVTTGVDLGKFRFMVGNNGKYAGKMVLSPAAAGIVQQLVAGGVCD